MARIATGAGRGFGALADTAPLLDSLGIRTTEPLGFNNTYALGMRRDRAAELQITKVSDLRSHPDLAFGFSNEFMDRSDGWPALRAVYGLPHKSVRGVDHDLAYRGLAAGSIDVLDLYSTDAEIAYYDLKVLRDDVSHFPRYEAVLVFRKDLASRFDRAMVLLEQLHGAIGEQRMTDRTRRGGTG